MSIYNLVLFLHIVGDITLFVGVSAQLLLLLALRRANDMNQVSMVIGFIPLTNGLGVGGSLLTIASGFYMALTAWGLRTSWILMALASILLIIGPLVAGIIEPRTRALVRMAGPKRNGALSAELSTRVQDSVLGLALHTNLAVVIGIVFLMTIKPALTGAIITMVTAVTVGVVSGSFLWRDRSHQLR